MSLRRTNSIPESPTLPAESPTSSDASSSIMEASRPREPCNVLLFESYLYKMPPLKKSILMKWSKRWFTLTRTDLADPTSIELTYYKDDSKREKKRTIDLNTIVGIRPTPRIDSADNIFAIETKDKKYVLRANDAHTKNTWLAKLCEYCGQEPVFHVTVPNQTAVTVYNEAILKLSSQTSVTIVLPSTSETLLSIQYADIRRMGYSDILNYDVIWFETCKNSQADRFFYFVVPSGIEVAKRIVQELKVTIQGCTSSLLILEDSTGIDVSYIAKEHYGCLEYSADSRAHILQSGLYQLPTLSLSYRYFSPCDRGRRESSSSVQAATQDTGMGGMSLEEFGRRKSNKSIKAPISRRPTLDRFVRMGSQPSFDRQSSVSSFDRQASVSSFDRSLLSTPSLDREMPSPSFQEHSDGHYSSGSASDVFDLPGTPHSLIKRQLSIQSSNSSQGSSNSSISHSPAIVEERQSLETFSFETTATTAVGGAAEEGRSFSLSGIGSGPTVPPRSVVSLQQDAAAAASAPTVGFFPGKLAAAH